MEFKFTAGQERFRNEISQFAATEWQGETEGSFGEGDDDEQWQRTQAFRRKLADRGWLTLAWPKEWGGLGAGFVEQAIYTEELLRAAAPAADQGADRVGPTLMMYGTDEQKSQFLPAVRRGDIVWCQGFSEPNAGSDLASLQTQAVLQGDDFIVNGSKIWTSNAHRANWMFMLARTDPEAPKHRGISYFLMDMNTPGITISPL